ncbi:hypothetical protein [Bacillus pseudomycoides]|uniref:hypothetical protein n=1 Tax=Bacillus pseudomycoides TaxID=64104 RepID=UPI00053502EA|nr:hypothetical protein [Bacillus pseudomycoides]
MEEQMKPRNTLDIEVNVDTGEAQEKIERLTQATERCTKAFEELGEAIASVGALLNGNQSEADRIEITTLLDGKKIAECVQNADMVRGKAF